MGKKIAGRLKRSKQITSTRDTKTQAAKSHTLRKERES